MTAEQLKNSILQETISGRLVPQDSNDEPVSSSAIIPEDDIPFEIPSTWAWVRLSDIYKFIDYRGSTPTKINNGIPLITAKNVKRGYNDYSIKDFISPEEYEQRKSRGISHRGDILFTTEAPLGNVSVADLDVFSAGQRLITFQARDGVDICNRAMMYFMLSPSFMTALQEKKTGTTVAGIKASKLKEILIPLPPLAEQKRIVAKLEELLPMVEQYGKAQKELDELNAALPARLRQSILQEAISGKLIPQDKNDEPALDCIMRILPNIAPCDNTEYDNLPDSWTTVKLLDICKLDTGKWDANHASPKGQYRFYTCSTQYMYSDTKRFE